MELHQFVLRHVETVSEHQINNVIMETDLDVLQDASLIQVLVALELLEAYQTVLQNVEIVLKHQINNVIMAKN